MNGNTFDYLSKKNIPIEVQHIFRAKLLNQTDPEEFIDNVPARSSTTNIVILTYHHQVSSFQLTTH